MISIELKVERDTPLAIADAIINREWGRVKEEYTAISAKENIRLIGQALINQSEATDRVDEVVKEVYGCQLTANRSR